MASLVSSLGPWLALTLTSYFARTVPPLEFLAVGSATVISSGY